MLIVFPSFKVSNSTLLKEVPPIRIVLASKSPEEAEIVVHINLPNEPVPGIVNSSTNEPVPSLRVPLSVCNTLS